jgi:hypothetical protein
MMLGESQTNLKFWRRDKYFSISGIRIPEGPARSLVTILTELSWLVGAILYFSNTSNILNMDVMDLYARILYKYVAPFVTIVRPEYNQV